MLGGKRKTVANGASAARGASKKDAIRDAITDVDSGIGSGRALVDMLCADDTLSQDAIARIRNLSERVLSPADLAGLLAFRVEKLRQHVENGDVSAERELSSWEKLGAFATSVVQLQTTSSSIGGASIVVEWGGYNAPISADKKLDNRRDNKIGDIIDTE